MSSIGARFFNGIRSAVNTVAVAEAHMAKAKDVKVQDKFPELGVLRFGTRFRSMPGQINPFTSGIRPATGPSVGRPGFQQFKGTGGAFSPENTLQLTTGMRGMQDPVSQVKGLLDTWAKSPAGSPKFSELGMFNNTELVQQMNDAGVPPAQQRLMLMQQAVSDLDRMFKLITSLMQAAHDVAMNSIRNLKG